MKKEIIFIGLSSVLSAWGLMFFILGLIGILRSDPTHLSNAFYLLIFPMPPIIHIPLVIAIVYYLKARRKEAKLKQYQ